MLHELFVLTLLVFASANDDAKNTKRSLNSFGFPSWNSFLGHSWPSHYSWQPISLAHGSLYPLSVSYLDKSHFNLGNKASHDLAAAVAAAKEATAVAVLAHQRVQVAREQVAIQERVAAAKDAAAHAAIQRSEAAAQVAAAVQKSAAASVVPAPAVHAANHISGPWIHSKPAFSHWG